MNIKYCFFTITVLCMVGCNKYLNEKSDNKLVVPDKLQDLQALMDLTTTTTTNDPNSLAISSDEYYLADNDWAELSTDYYKRMYAWDSSDLFQPQTGDWYNCYKLIYTANTVLDDIIQIDKQASNIDDWNNIYGQALFYRGKAFYEVAAIWCKTFDSATMKTDLGIPIRIDPDFNIPSTRATLKETYTQLLSDLQQSAIYLPTTPIHPMRPSKGAAYGMLARIYLFMRDYVNAEKYADSALTINSQLIDLNSLDTAKTYPFSQFNNETIYYCSMVSPSSLTLSKAKINPLLYNMFDNSDLRKKLFFKVNTDGSYGFKGSYTGGGTLFDGIAVNELMLILAESYIRQANKSQALTILNKLLINRYSNKVTYKPFSSVNADSILNKILEERRKDLIMHGLWWSDVKRLNKERRNISLYRTLQGNPLVLEPNSKRFVLPIPEDIIQLTGMQQN